VKALNVKYTEEALDRIINITKGYPFFIQQFCKLVYQKAENDIIEKNEVEDTISEFFETLDNGFFKVRYERCADSDKKFIFAMVKCEELPCTISHISKELGKKGKTISPTRAQLINKGIIYPVRYSELDFTVPESGIYCLFMTSVE